MADAANPEVRKAGAWVIVWGVLLIVTGLVAIMKPAVAALAFELLLGWLLIFAGIVELIYAIQERGKDGFTFSDLLTGAHELCTDGMFGYAVQGLGISERYGPSQALTRSKPAWRSARARLSWLCSLTCTSTLALTFSARGFLG